VSDFDQDWDTRPREEPDYFNAADAARHLLIVKVHDVARYYRSENFPDGMVYPTSRSRRQFEPFPNQVVRCSIVDLSVEGADGAKGKIYAEATLFPSSLTKITKEWVGTPKKLVVFDKGPRQTDEFTITNLATNERALAIAKEFLARHPEFDQIPAPEPYDGHPPMRGGFEQGRDDRGQGRRDDRGFDDRGRNDAYARDPWDEPQRGGQGGRRDTGAQDWGQHDDRRFDDRPRASDGGGSFLENVTQQNHYGEPQRDEDIPF
jgi:hypothetical protein